MGFWSRVKGIFGEKRQGTGFELARWNNAPMRKGTPELLRTYREMPLLRNIVELIGDNVADISWRAYKRKAKDGQPVKDFTLRSSPPHIRRARIKSLMDASELVEVPDHPILALLEDPNDHITGRAITKLSTTHHDLVGDVFWALEKRAGFVVGYWPLAPSWVVQLPDYREAPDRRTFTVVIAGKIHKLPAADVLHFRNHDPDDPLGRGIGTGLTLGDELDTDEYAARFVKNYFWNSAMPAGVVAVEGLPADPNNPMTKALRETLLREHQGPDKAGKLALANGKISFARLDTSFKDMELINLRKYLKDFIRETYRVPPEVIGNITNSNKATAFAAREILAEQVVQPRMEFWRTELQKRLVPLFGAGDIILDYESPIPADREHQLRVMTAFREAYKVNEVRALSDHRPDGARGDEYLAPSPGSKPSTPEVAPGSAEEAKEESAKKALAGDPPWVADLKPQQ